MHGLFLWICYVLFSYMSDDWVFTRAMDRHGYITLFNSMILWFLKDFVLYLIPFWVSYTYVVKVYLEKNRDKLYKIGFMNMIIYLVTTILLLPLFVGAFTFGFTNAYFGFFVVMTSVFTVPYILKAPSFHKLLMEYEDKGDTMGKIQLENTLDMI